MTVIMYSKPNCTYCRRAKAFFEMRNIEYVERTVGVDTTREQLLEAAPNARTVPQIFINNELIGGYTELMEYVENTGFTGTGYTL